MCVYGVSFVLSVVEISLIVRLILNTQPAKGSEPETVPPPRYSELCIYRLKGRTHMWQPSFTSNLGSFQDIQAKFATKSFQIACTFCAEVVGLPYQVQHVIYLLNQLATSLHLKKSQFKPVRQTVKVYQVLDVFFFLVLRINPFPQVYTCTISPKRYDLLFPLSSVFICAYYSFLISKKSNKKREVKTGFIEYFSSLIFM